MGLLDLFNDPEQVKGLLSQQDAGGMLNNVAGRLSNAYGAGGDGDPLVALGLGIASKRNLSDGLQSGLQDMQRQKLVQAYAQRQQAADKLAAEREARNAAFQQAQLGHMNTTDQLNQQRFASEQQQQAQTLGLREKELGLTEKRLAQPQLMDVPQQDGTVVKQWVMPGQTSGVAVGAPTRLRTPESDAAARENAMVQSRLEQGQKLGLQGDELKRFALTNQMVSPNEKVTNDQANAALFARRMDASNQILSKPEISNAGLGMSGVKSKVLESIPVVGNFGLSPEYQQMRQAQSDFINATLRRESGAAISPGEFDNANKQYFPQPGDSPEVIAQKAANRQNALSGILGASAPSFQKSFSSAANTGKQPETPSSLPSWRIVK
jgi:hypothetical protein